jgi:hypothetical protein
VKLRFFKINLRLGRGGVNQAAGRQLAIAGLDNVGSLTSHNPIGLHGLQREWLASNMIKDLGEIGWRGLDWIDLALGMDQWRALLDTKRTVRCEMSV